MLSYICRLTWESLYNRMALVGFNASPVNGDYNIRSLNKKASGAQYFIMALVCFGKS